MSLRVDAATDPGPRPGNQDAHFVDLDLGLVVVADGMGGHNAGEVASRMAVDAVVEFIRATRNGAGHGTWPVPPDPARPMILNRLNAALHLANRTVFDAGVADPARAGMGTTIVVALIEDDMVAIAHVGDSRAYRLRDGRLEQMTADHTWMEVMRQAGAIPASDHPMRHVLTSGIGMDSALRPGLLLQPLLPGDRWLLCTDGVHGALDDEALRTALDDAASDTAGSAVRLALAAGTRDNATAVVLNVV